MPLNFRADKPKLYDFSETLAQLDDISEWLNDLGFTALDRVRIYRRNIRLMIKVERSGGFEALQSSMSYTDAREIFWSHVDADEFVRAAAALRTALGDDAALAPIKLALNGPADLALETARNSQGRNYMFELVMAGRLAVAGLRPAFGAGPDVHIDFDGLRISIQCKRPFSLSKLEKTSAMRSIS